MKKMAICLLLTLSGSAYAGTFTGNVLLNMMQHTGTADEFASMLYVDGVTDSEGLAVMAEITSAPGKKKLSRLFFCIPEGVVKGQLYDVIKKYLINNPEIRQRPAGSLVRDALIRAWPCPGNPFVLLEN